MPKVLRMPEVAAGSTEAVLSQWLVEEGAGFSAGDLIAAVETDKAVVEIEAEQDATLAQTLVNAGATVEVGSPVAVLLAPGEQVADMSALLAKLGVETSGRRETKAATNTANEPTKADSPGPHVSTAAQMGERVFASPLARRLLKDAGLSLSDVEGTGPHGRIVRKDVEHAIATKVNAAPEPPATHAGSVPPPQAAPPISPLRAKTTPLPVAATGQRLSTTPAETTPHTRLRRTVAARLTHSKQTAPHFYLKGSARLDALLALRSQINEASPVHVSVNDFLIKATAFAHRRVPELNVIWQDDGMLHYTSADIGVAIASSRGLVTPVLRSVGSLSLSAVAQRVKEFVEQANDGRLSQRDLEGGTLTITNLGMYGVEEFSAIINPPQTAILAVGAGRREPVVGDDGQIDSATLMRVVLSVDHRAADGADAALWMNEFVKAVEKPVLLLT
ncbi:Dihydrolipoyllysine-residue acetyltransferase component of pyruvate dehydrogenase complex [Streptomyces sp. MBT84]|uniref:dihydrolipoamide acetyltransferase family protein n=1 Tax=Streptomyces sp. MBT84 TaxID=1488414 RepID=UPI001C6F1146|nr:dihydrolipoamide acetyltransferase family protein [Streptomyces sp. MBT84]MBW8699099.1 Dihydrolipoyllysine-residue acetyltransferase component of pyruvate dehydrogenase complex [Streptomyces sp. MBT84]